jgi:hypothetical protein
MLIKTGMERTFFSYSEALADVACGADQVSTVEQEGCLGAGTRCLRKDGYRSLRDCLDRGPRSRYFAMPQPLRRRAVHEPKHVRGMVQARPRRRQDRPRRFEDQFRPWTPHAACAKELDLDGPVPNLLTLA